MYSANPVQMTLNLSFFLIASKSFNHFLKCNASLQPQIGLYGVDWVKGLSALGLSSCE